MLMQALTSIFNGGECHNPNIRFVIKCRVQRPMSQENVFGCETHFQKWGKCK